MNRVKKGLILLGVALALALGLEETASTFFMIDAARSSVAMLDPDSFFGASRFLRCFPFTELMQPVDIIEHERSDCFQNGVLFRFLC